MKTCHMGINAIHFGSFLKIKKIKNAHANSHQILLETFSIPILLKQATLVKAGIPPQDGIHLAFVSQS